MTFTELLAQSILIQGLLTLAIVLTVLIRISTGQEVPQELWQLLWAVVGFYFGSKVENAKAIRFYRTRKE